jgi:small-conductance mechanosensitive channel
MDAHSLNPNIDWPLTQRSVGPAIFVLGGWILGVLIERIAVGRLKAIAARTSWEGDDILIDAFRGLFRWIGALIGLHIALFRWTISDSAGAWLEKSTVIAAVLVATVFASRTAVGFVKLSTRTVEGVVPSMTIFHSITRVVVFALGILIALQSVGISIAPILTALGVGGLATALALLPTLANLFSGIQILASRTINPGDFVKLDSSEEGFVQDINWRTTTIRNPSNNLVLVPNSRVANAVVVNHQYPDREVVVGVAWSVPFGSDLSKVERLAEEVGLRVQQNVAGAVPTFVPVARFTQFTEAGVAFNVGLRAAEYGDQFLLKHEFIKLLDARFRAEGVELPYPHRVMLQKDSNPSVA